MSDLVVFENAEFGQVRTLMIHGEPWFVAKDVCKVFGDTNHIRSVGRVDDDEKSIATLTDRMGREQQATIVNESGLYALLFAMQPQKANNHGVSDAYPIAAQERIEKLRAFRRWVTSEILPAIRKHGLYATDETIERLLADPDLLISTLQRLKEERQKRKELEAKLEEDKPYTEFARSVASASDSIYVGDFAKLVCNSGINIGRTRLFRWLREQGYLMENNTPYQRYVDQGLFVVKESCIRTVYGDMVKFTTLITGKGQMALLEALRQAFGNEASGEEIGA